MRDERGRADDWVNDVTCDIGLRQYLDADIKHENESYVRSSKVPSWYPSDLGGSIFNRLLKRRGAEALEFDERTLRKFEIGKLWEARLHRALDACIARENRNIKEIDLHPEATLEAFKKRVENNELELRGFYDRLLLVKIGDDWKVVVYEVKTVNSVMFHHQKREGEQPRGNRMQLMFYMERLSSPENWQKLVKIAQERYQIAPNGILGVLTQVSKDDGAMWERTYEFDPELFAEIKKEIDTLNEHWKAGTFPPKPLIIVKENGSYKVNFEVAYSPFAHYLIGDNYATVLMDAKKVAARYSYYKTKNPLKLGEVERQIQTFNENYGKFYPERLSLLLEGNTGGKAGAEGHLREPSLESSAPIL